MLYCVGSRQQQCQGVVPAGTGADSSGKFGGCAQRYVRVPFYIQLLTDVCRSRKSTSVRTCQPIRQARAGDNQCIDSKEISQTDPVSSRCQAKASTSTHSNQDCGRSGTNPEADPVRRGLAHSSIISSHRERVSNPETTSAPVHFSRSKTGAFDKGWRWNISLLRLPHSIQIPEP